MRSKFQVIWSKQDDAIAKQQRFEGQIYARISRNFGLKVMKNISSFSRLFKLRLSYFKPNENLLQIYEQFYRKHL